MNIPKAIEIKEKYQYILQDASIPEVLEADKLSIEALKTIKAERTIYGFKRQFKLPGETED